MVDWFARPAAPKVGESFSKGADGGKKPPQNGSQDQKSGNNYNGSGGWAAEYQKLRTDKRQPK